MKRILPLLLAGAGLMAGYSAQGRDVYVYTAQGEALGKLSKVKRVEFNNEKLTLVPVSGTNVDVDLDKFGFLSFKQVELGGVDEVISDDVKVRMDGDMLCVDSPVEVKSVSIYNVLGERLGYVEPSATTATMIVNNRGLNIIVVETAGGVKSTHKIVR